MYNIDKVFDDHDEIMEMITKQHQLSQGLMKDQQVLLESKESQIAKLKEEVKKLMRFEAELDNYRDEAHQSENII